MLTTCARLVLVACAALALLAGTSLPAPASQPQDEPDTHALALECRGALWKRAFDEATAAGLNPGAIAVEFTASKASRRDEGADAILTGVEDYRPTTDVPPSPSGTNAGSIARPASSAR